MAANGSTETNSTREVLRRLNILVGLLAVVAAFLGVLVAHLVSESFVPAFMIMLLFGLGVLVIVRSVLG